MRRECEKQCLLNRCMQRYSSRSISCVQGLPDHAHEPTLKRISKDKLLIASPAGAKVAEGLGFTNVVTLDHGQETMLGNGKLRIKATVGMHPPPPSHLEPCSNPSSSTASSKLCILSVLSTGAACLCMSGTHTFSRLLLAAEGSLLLDGCHVLEVKHCAYTRAR